MFPPVLWVYWASPRATFSTFFLWRHPKPLFTLDCWPLSLEGERRHSRSVGGVLVVYTHCLADTCVACLIDPTYEDPASEGDVEAEVDQHVPKLAAHTDRPGCNGHTTHHRINMERCWLCVSSYYSIIIFIISTNNTIYIFYLIIQQLVAVSNLHQ